MESSGFLDTGNKAMLWELISDTGIFDSLATTTNKQELVTMFESTLNDVDKQDSGSLQEKNRRFLDIYVGKLKTFKQEYRREDLQKQRESLFEERFKMRQLEFKQYDLPPPPTINFLDQSVETIPVSSAPVQYTPIPIPSIPIPSTPQPLEFKPDILSELREIKAMLRELLQKKT